MLSGVHKAGFSQISAVSSCKITVETLLYKTNIVTTNQKDK